MNDDELAHRVAFFAELLRTISLAMLAVLVACLLVSETWVLGLASVATGIGVTSRVLAIVLDRMLEKNGYDSDGKKL